MFLDTPSVFVGVMVGLVSYSVEILADTVCCQESAQTGSELSTMTASMMDNLSNRGAFNYFSMF